MFKSLFKRLSTGRSRQFPQIIAILCGSISGITNGMLVAWTSPAIPELIASKSINISLEEASYFTVISPISIILVAPFLSILLDKMGRKASFILVATPQLLCWIFIGLANNVWLFYVARVFAGIGDAAFFSVYPTYVCEISQPKVRGSWGTLTTTSVYFGMFLVNVIGSFNNIQTTALISGILPILQVVILPIMPESPYYLLAKGRDQEARESLEILHWRNDVDDMLLALKADVTRQISERGTWKDLFTIGSNRKALLICIGIRMTQQFSGFTAIQMYTQYIFQNAGGDISYKTSAIIQTGISVATVALSLFSVEKFGRRPSMIFSSFGCGIILTIETVYFCIVQFTDLDTLKVGWFPLGGMLLYASVSAVGMGTIPTLVAGEIFSASVKGRAISVLVFIIAIWLLIIPKVFQTLTYNFGLYAPFCLFSISSILGGIFSWFFLIETKGKTLEQIQQELKGNT